LNVEICYWELTVRMPFRVDNIVVTLETYLKLIDEQFYKVHVKITKGYPASDCV
jgi:hypothetical protein